MKKRRFTLAPSGVFIRDIKHWESYGEVDDIIDLMNRVNETDNCAVDLIKKELKEQEDENVKKVLKKILSLLDHISTQQ